MKNISVLVTGGAGFIGANLVRMLLKLDYKVTVFDNFSTGRYAYLEGLPVDIVEGDVLDRDLLVEVLEDQNSMLSLSSCSVKNIRSITSKNTFTVSTGHQLCLCTGPLYFIYKIISTINLSEELKNKYPENNFVPIFWMASEDHDFDEVNHINLFKNKFSWKSNQKGAVGQMKLEKLKDVIKEIEYIYK